MGLGRRERVKAKIKLVGIEGMTQCEVLEFLLYPFIPRKDTVPIAKDLLSTFGSLEQVLDSTPEALLTVKGVTPFASTVISSLKDIVNRAGTEKFTKEVEITNYNAAGEYLCGYIGNEPKEKFVALFFGAKGRVISAKEISVGNAVGTSFDLTKITTIAVNLGATAVIVAHNHPSGDLTPSMEDYSCTASLDDALRALGIKLWDHIVVSGKNYDSIKRKMPSNRTLAGLNLGEPQVDYDVDA